MNLYPLPAGLEFSSDAAPDEKPKLVAFLESVQPTVERAIDASRLPLEPFPDSPQLDAEHREDIQRHPKVVVQRLARLLLTDASRCFDKHDTNGALLRIAAALRFARSLAEQDSLLYRLTASRILTQSCRKLEGIVEKGSEIGPIPAVAEVRSAFAMVDAEDPATISAAWDRDARASISKCREEYAVAGGPKRYAEYIRSSDPHLNAALASMGAVAPDVDFVDRAAKIKPSELAGALDRAEAVIADIAAAMRKGDDSTFQRCFQVVRDDPTQVSRVALGGAGLIFTNLQQTRAAVTAGKTAIEKLHE